MTALNGYSLPLSPKGQAALVPPPPWHFSGTVLMVEFLLDAEVLAAHLPHGLEVDPENPRAAAIFGEWQSCTDAGEELVDPGRAQYREFYIALSARHNGESVARCLYCWVDHDLSLVRGLIQGYPKKLGQISITRSYGAGLAGAPLTAGTRLAGTLTAAGRRIAELGVTLERPGTAPELMTAPLAHSRIFPAWAPGGAAIDELVSGGSTDQHVGDVWSGPATLNLLPSPVDELDALAPAQILRGYRFEFSETITGGRLLARTGR